MDLSLTPIAASDITPSSLTELHNLGVDLLQTLPSHPPAANPTTVPTITWSPTKSSDAIQVFTAKYGNEPWIGRVMKAPWLRYELAKEGLWTKKAETERESVGKEGDEVDVQGEWKKVLGEEEEKGKGKREYWVQDVRKLLHIQAFSAREFLETVICYEFPVSPSSPYRRSFLVLSKPKIGDLKDPKDVRGVYTCVERVFEMKKDEDGVELFFAITSDAGGSIPRWVQNMAMPKQIFSDAEGFLEYFEKRKEANGTVQKDGDDDGDDDYELV